MSFLHISLAAIGSAFVAIPIFLHLLMRQRPKHFIFPALRFVQSRKKVNQRNLQLRHLALLMLRCLSIAALALALSRPFVPSTQVANGLLLSLLAVSALAAISISIVGFAKQRGRALSAAVAGLGLLLASAAGALGWRMYSSQAPIVFGDPTEAAAAAFVFDVAPRMGYTHENKNRLEAAREAANHTIRELPLDSQIAVLDTTSDRVAFAVDRNAAEASMKSLQVAFESQALPETINSAIRLLRSSDLPRKEIYVLTDLSQSSWPSLEASNLPEQLAEDPPILVFVIDVGTQEVRNVSLSDLRTSGAYLAAGQPLRLEASVAAAGTGTTQQLELYVEKPDPNRPVMVDGKPLLPEVSLRSRRSVEVPKDSSVAESFVLQGLGKGIHHGYLRIAGTDGLPVDNRRYFSVEVIEPWKVLIAVAPDAMPDLESALSPAAFKPELINIDELGQRDFSDYAAIALLDPPALPPQIWRGLASFVSSGGGLGIFLGREARPLTAFNEGEPQRVLPGTLKRQWRSGAQPLVVRVGATPHPAIDTLRARGSSIPWSDFPIFRHWVLGDLKSETTTIARISNDHPLLLERPIGNGQVVTMTTPISDPLNVAGRSEWNRLPTGPEPWPYFVMMNDLFTYLVQSGGSELNYEIGQPAVLRTAPLGISPRLQVFHPQSAWQELASSGNTVTYRFTNAPGTYRLRNANDRQRQIGFSVNLQAAATRIERIETERLDNILGKENYLLTDDAHQIRRKSGEARRGRDFYPWLLLMLAIVLALEFVLANRFYPVAEPVPDAA